MKFLCKIAVSVALSIYLMLLIAPQAQIPRWYDGNLQQLFIFSMDSHHPVFTQQGTDQYLTTFPAWGKRFGGCIITGWLWDECLKFLSTVHHIGASNYSGAGLLFGGYYAAWFLLTCILLAAHLGGDCFIPILGTFAGLCQNLAQCSLAVWMPWDVSSMFWFTWAILLGIRKDFKWLPLVILAGSFFKETCAVSVLLLLTAGLWRFGLTATACVALRYVGDRAWALHIGYTPNVAIWHNLGCLMPQLNWFGFTDCGLILFLWFFPLPKTVKLTCAALLGGLFVYGHFDETREYLDFIPVCCIGLVNQLKKKNGVGFARCGELKNFEPGTPEFFDAQKSLLLSRPLVKRIYDDWYARLLKDADSAKKGGLLVELGSGGSYLKSIRPNVITSDVIEDVADRVIDGRDLPFKNNSVQALFLTHAFHHIPDVGAFLKEADRVLVNGGVISMIEVAHTPFAKLFFKNFHHEPYNDYAQEWKFDQQDAMMDCNQALSWMVFYRDRKEFENRYPDLKVERAAHLPWLTYFLSGGVTSPYLIPRWMERPLVAIEKLLQPFAPLFSLHWHICIRKAPLIPKLDRIGRKLTAQQMEAWGNPD